MPELLNKYFKIIVQLKITFLPSQSFTPHHLQIMVERHLLEGRAGGGGGREKEKNFKL